MSKRDDQNTWRSALSSVDSLADGLGMPVDGGIRDTVAIMKILGVNTIASCEGHLQRGYGPYVSFEASGADTDRRRLTRLKRAGQDDTGSLTRKIIAKMSREEIAERRKLFAFLDEFYTNSPKPQTHRLVVENLGFGAAVLRPQNAILIGKPSGETANERKRLLQIARFEMKDFTEFLMSKLLGGGGPESPPPGMSRI